VVGWLGEAGRCGASDPAMCAIAMIVLVDASVAAGSPCSLQRPVLICGTECGERQAKGKHACVYASLAATSRQQCNCARQGVLCLMKWFTRRPTIARCQFALRGRGDAQCCRLPAAAQLHNFPVAVGPLA
jgi:hypothetical protein